MTSPGSGFDFGVSSKVSVSVCCWGPVTPAPSFDPEEKWTVLVQKISPDAFLWFARARSPSPGLRTWRRTGVCAACVLYTLPRNTVKSLDRGLLVEIIDHE